MNELIRRLEMKARLRIDHLPLSELDRLRAVGAIVEEPSLLRPRYFDGRFLAARDLERDQEYFSARQRELASAFGSGVLSGLVVKKAGDFGIAIEPGTAITESGRLIVLIPPNGEQVLNVNLADVATIQQLDASFGLLDTPRTPPRNRSGLFVIALRPVEYTANPVGSYPSAIEERRQVMDGEIIEATAVTLIPIQDPAFEARPAQQRSLAARRIFVESAGAPAVEDVVPLAILQLETGIVRWVDPFLVRREIGAEHAGIAAFGASKRAVREAYLQQYQAQLRDALRSRVAARSSLRFAASELFRALPPVGPLPAAALDLASSTQFWFPPGLQAAHQVVPDDELTTLVGESLLLDPIDLQAPAEQLAQIAVLIVTPAPRSTLSGASAKPVPLVSGLPAALPPSSNVLQLLGSAGFRGLRAPRPATPAPSTDATDATVTEGDGAEPAVVWYLRRRLLHSRPETAVVAATTIGE